MTYLDNLDQETNKLNSLIESRKNKIDKLSANTAGEAPEEMNTLSAEDLQYNVGEAFTHGIMKDDNGNKFKWARTDDGGYQRDDKGNFITEPYTGKTRTLYIDHTEDGNYKLGLAASDVNPEFKSPWTGESITPYEARYMNQTELGNPYLNERKNLYDGTPGPKGVTPGNGQAIEVELPEGIANRIEYLVHSNKGQIANRAMGQGPKTPETEALFGSGQTEYTTPNAPLWNIDYDVSKAQVDSNTVLPSLPKTALSREEFSKLYQDTAINPASSFTDELVQLPGAAVSGVVGGIMDLADFGAELGQAGVNAVAGTKYKGGLFENETIDNAKTFAGNLLGYSTRLDEQQHKEIKEKLDEGLKGVNIVNPATYDNIDIDKVAEGLWLGLQDPTTAAYSLGIMLGSASLGGKVGKAVGSTLLTKGAKAASKTADEARAGIEAIKADKTMNAADKAAEISKLQDNITNTATMIKLGRNMAGPLSYGMSMTNEDLKAYRENNNGSDPSIERLLGMTLANTVAVAVPDVALTKAALGMNNTLNKALTDSISSNVARAAAAITLSGIGEIPQGSVQAIVQNINQKWETEKYAGKTMKDTIADASADIIGQGLLEGVGGVHMATPRAAGIVGANLLKKPTEEELAAYIEKETAKAKKSSIDNIANNLGKKEGIIATPSEELQALSVESIDNIFNSTENPEDILNKLNENKLKIMEDVYEFDPATRQIVGIKDLDKIKAAEEWFGQYAQAQADSKGNIPSYIQKELDYINEANIKYTTVAPDTLETKAANAMAAELKESNSVDIETDIDTKLDNFINAYKLNESMEADKVAELKSNIKKQVLDKFNISGMIDIPGVTYDLDNEAFSELVKENAGLKTNLDSKGMKRGGTTVEIGSVSNEELSNIMSGEGSSFDLSNHNTKLRERRIRKLDPLETRNVTDTLVDVNTKMDVAIANNREKAGKLFKGGDILGNLKRLMLVAINTIDGQTASDTEQRASTTTDDSMIKSDQYWASKNNVMEQIGKDYASSHGLKLTGNKVALAKAYRDLGRFAIDLLKDADLVQESDEMWSRVGKTIGEDNNPLGVTNTKGVSLKQSSDSLTNSSTLLVKDKGVRLKDTNERVSSTDTDKKTQKYSSKIGDAVKRVVGLMLPGTERVPSTDKPGNKNVKVAEGIQIDDKSIEIIKNTDNKPHKAKKSGKMIQILEYLKSLNDTTTGGLSAAIRNNSRLKDFLLLSSNGSTLLEESNSGSIQGKLDNLIGLLDNLETISTEDGIHYTLQVDINDRLTVEQTVANYQGDKVYARPLMGVGEYKIDSSDTGARDLLIESIVDELATKNEQKTMSKEDILNYYSDLYSKIEEASNGNVGDLMEIVSSTPGLNHLKRKGGFRILSALQGARDVVSSGGGNILTEYIPEKDASASGVFNYMMNLAGRNVDLFKQRLLDLGVTINGISETNTTDAYTILQQLVNRLINDYEARDPEVGVTGKLEDVEAVKKLRDTLNDDKFMRDLAKYPIMTWFYSAGQVSIVENLVLEATKELIGKGIDGDPAVLAYISDITGKNMTASDIKRISKGSAEHKALRAELAKVGNVFYDNLTKAFPEVEKNKKEMEELFDFLEKEGKANGVDYWEGRIRTAISVLHGDPKTTSLYKMKNKALNLTPEEKIAQGLTTEDESLSLITIMDKVPNRTSMMAFFAHLVDSAQAISWLGASDSKYGIQSKHDGFSGRPQDLIQSQKAVEELNNRIAVEYDFMNEMAIAMKDTADRMENDLENYITPSKAKELERRIKNLRDKAAQVEAVNNPRIEAKKELFKNAQTYLFGKTGIVEEATNSKSTSTVETNPEEVKATAVKNVKDNIFDVISDLDTLDERKNDILTNRDNLKVVSVVGSTKDDLLKSKEFGKEFKDRVRSGTSFTYNGTVYIGEKAIKGIDEITNKKATAEQILDLVSHELEHAAIDTYIDNEASGAVKREVSTINTILERAATGKIESKVSPRAKQRIEYVLSKMGSNNNQAVKELVAISQEDTVAAEVLNELNRMAGIKTGGVLSKLISNIWNKVKELMQSTPIDTLLDNTDVYSLSVAIESIRQQSRGVEGVGKVKNAIIPDKTTPFDSGAVNKIVSINGEKISISNYTKNIDPIC